MIFTYFRYNNDLNGALGSNASIDRNGFIKLLVLGVFDVIITMPLQVIGLVTDLLFDGSFSFWPGWKAIHGDFSTIPMATSEEWKAGGSWTIFAIRFDQWDNPILALAFFLLFGLTEQKRSWYRSIFWRAVKPFGFRPRVDPVVSSIAFASVPGPIVNTGIDCTQGTVV